MKTDVIINRDALLALRELPADSVHCCVTSPPYYALRDYGLDAQIGREDTPEQYIERLVEVFHELKRVLRSDGTFWLNIADTYCGTGNKCAYTDPKNPKGRNGQSVSIARQAAVCKQKDLIGIPWLLAFALRRDGWYLRSDIIWQKENPMPESCKDRPSRSYEHIFLLTKSKQYFYDAAAIAEPIAPTLRLSPRSFLAFFMACPKALKSYFSTGLFIICSPCYILQFPFLFRYVYTVHIISRNRAYYSHSVSCILRVIEV